MTTFGLLDLLGAMVATIFAVAMLMALPVGWVRAAVLLGGGIGYVLGWWSARMRGWEYKLLLPAGGTLLGLGLGWLIWGVA